MAVIKKDLGGMRVRINVLGGMAVICRSISYSFVLSQTSNAGTEHYDPGNLNTFRS
jgi:hypothetical protein